MTARTLIAGLEVFAVGIVESLSGQRVDREPDVDVLIVGAGIQPRTLELWDAAVPRQTS